MRNLLSSIDIFSFWLGAAVATVFWLVIGALRPIFRQVGDSIRAKREEAKAKARSTTLVEEHYLVNVLKHAQGQHLAAPLFALDEVVLPPVLLAPPPRVEPGEAAAHLDDAVSLSIPYLPAWPELACIYQTPTLTLSQALSGNSDIVLTGQPGAGKTVALAYLASRLARRDPEPGLPPDTIPFLIHVADIELPLKKEDPLAPLVDHIAERASMFDASRIPEFVENVFSQGRALLLIDGTDELTPMGLGEVTKYIRTLKRAYPKTRIVTTANPDYLDGLVTLNFIPFVLAAWGADKRNAFYEKWGNLWNEFVAKETWAQTLPDPVDPILLNRWLTADTAILTPLELTLKAWGAYAGDTRGPRTLDAIESHLRRVSPAETPREALDMLALQVHLAAEPIFDPRKAREWIKSYEPPEETPPPEEEEAESKTEKGKKKSNKQEKHVAPSLGLISKLAESGLLAPHLGNKMRFLHPVFGGYLAGNILGSYKPEAVIDQPPWSGKSLSMQYFAARGDASNMVDILLSRTDRPFERNLLAPARWLRDAPRTLLWRGKVMARLVELLQQDGLPLGLRGQALSAFIASDDPAVATLFRQLFHKPSAELLQLCALGSGAIRDAKAIDELAALVNHPSPNVGRAACLALVKIGTTAAIDVVADCLLHGSETLRRAAAEALADHPAEGHAILREGVAVNDILVRRAVTYGLGYVDEPWADELLTKMQTDEKEWIVRTAATEVIERKTQFSPHIPRRLPMPSESAWLIAFAGKQGMGVSPDKPPTDILLSALKSGEEEERLAALSYLRMMPNEGVFGALFQAMYGGDPTMREAVFLTLLEMSARGVDVPDPIQFGVGA
jgi:HEAT repeat protein